MGLISDFRPAAVASGTQKKAVERTDLVDVSDDSESTIQKVRLNVTSFRTAQWVYDVISQTTSRRERRSRSSHSTCPTREATVANR